MTKDKHIKVLFHLDRDEDGYPPFSDNESGKIDRKNNIKMLEKYYNLLLQKIDE